MDVLGAGFPDFAFQGGHEGGGLAANESAAAASDLDGKIKTRAENIFSEQPIVLRLLDGQTQIFNRQRILVTNVNIPFVAADGVSADYHAFQHTVRVAFHQRGP